MMRVSDPGVSVCFNGTKAMGAMTADSLWDEDDLIGRLCQSLDFAECAVRELGACGDADDAELPAGVSFERLIAETGVLLLAASNVASYAAVGPRILRVASLLVPHARSLRILQAICLEPAAALEHATAHICLKRLGFYDGDFDALLDLSVGAMASDGRERVPHQMLEQEWLKQGWLYPEGLPRLKAGPQMAYCALTRTMDLLAGTREDVQGFTRALMRLRDFNLFARPLPRSRESLLADAEGMLARCLEQEDYDLAGEVLLAWPLTGESWSAAATFGFRVVMAARPEGLSCAFSGHDACGTAGFDAVYRAVYHAVYHAAYGMGTLCAACLAHGKRPPVKVPSGTVRAGSFAAVMDCLDGGGSPALWMEKLSEMDAAESEPLAEFVLGIALHRAFRRREFGTMERLLTVAKRLGLGRSPLAGQAAEMLRRVEQCMLASPEGRAWDRSKFVEEQLCDEVVEVSYQVMATF